MNVSEEVGSVVGQRFAQAVVLVRAGEHNALAMPTSCSFRSQTVLEVYDATAKAALVQQLELGMDAGGQGALATAH